MRRYVDAPAFNRERLEWMDAAFRRRVFAAVADDLENCPTSLSTAYGTRYPVFGYRRED
jgi:hypothetical protein